MRFPVLVITIFTLLSIACNERKPEAATTPAPKSDSATTEKSSEPYFPVFSFLKDEIDYVDSLPVGIMRYNLKPGKTDSAYITLHQFHGLVNEFLSPELKDSAFRHSFRETSFVDRGNGNATFLYTASDSTNSVRRVDVITAKGLVYDEVRSFYLEKSQQLPNATVTKKLIWNPKRNFQLITVTRRNDAPSTDETIKVVWDNRDEQ